MGLLDRLRRKPKPTGRTVYASAKLELPDPTKPDKPKTVKRG